MIASLNGRILNKTATHLLLDVGGVGYELAVSAQTCAVLPETGEACFIHVQTVMREDSLTLYGFAERAEKELFLLLVTVSGIGPKLGQTILSGIGVAALRRAIATKDIDQLTTLPGIGKKTAQRLCVELADKLGTLEAGQAGVTLIGATAEPLAVLDDAASILTNLGFPRPQAASALETIRRELQTDESLLEKLPSVQELVRRALLLLGGR